MATVEESKASRPDALDARSLCEAFQITAERMGDRRRGAARPTASTELTLRAAA